MSKLIDTALSKLLKFIVAFVVMFFAIIVGYPLIVVSSVALVAYYTVAVVKLTYQNFLKGE